MANLMQASNQWANRPADERYWNLQDLLRDTMIASTQVANSQCQFEKLSVVPHENRMLLQSNTGQQAELTNWSLGQVCSRVKAPTDYIMSLPADFAAENINFGLQRYGDKKTNLLLNTSQDSLPTCRAFNGTGYTRIWNSAIVERLLQL